MCIHLQEFVSFCFIYLFSSNAGRGVYVNPALVTKKAAACKNSASGISTAKVLTSLNIHLVYAEVCTYHVRTLKTLQGLAQTKALSKLQGFTD